MAHSNDYVASPTIKETCTRGLFFNPPPDVFRTGSETMDCPG
jgi:hypothetical protein